MIPPISSKTYRAEIDGLRAIAVSVVVLYHAKVPGFGGGYIGVDIFFVISGFLITGILYSEKTAGTVSILSFYERRCRRILPALIVVSAVSAFFAWLWMFPADLAAFGQSLFSANLYISNIYFWLTTDYFGTGAELKPLIHTWSLSVEEQYYILFPILLILFPRLTRRQLIALVFGLSAASLLFAQWASQHAPGANFFLLPSRIFQLGIGALVLLVAGGSARPKTLAGDLAAALGLILLIASAILFDDNSPSPGLISLVPLSGTVLLLLYASPSTLAGRLLTLRPVVAIGAISYSAYLWHQPIFVFARLRLLNTPSPAIMAGLIVLSFLLAWLSWRYVEQPFRNRAWLTRRSVFSGAVVASALLIAMGLSMTLTNGFPGRISPNVLAAESAAQSGSPARTRCHAKPPFSVPPEKACVLGRGYPPKIAVWGDSHGNEVAWQLSLHADDLKSSIRQFTFSLCPPVPGIAFASGSVWACDRANRSVLDYLQGQPETEIVILIARWPHYMERDAFDNGEGGQEYALPRVARPINGAAGLLDEADRIQHLGALYRESVTQLLSAGKKVALIYPVPEVGWDVPRQKAKRLLFDPSGNEPISTSYPVFLARNRWVFDAFEKLPPDKDLVEIRPDILFCDSWLAGRCAAEKDGELLYFDDDHLSLAGAEILAQSVILSLQDAGWVD